MHKIFPFIFAALEDWELTSQLIARDIKQRYRGSQLGLAWTMINPLIMLGVYTLVFSQVFKARWGNSSIEQSPLTFGINLFAGLIVFSLFAECATRAPTLITSNPNYVKKIVFPLHALGEMVVGSALFHAMTSCAVLIIARIIIEGSLPSSALILPVCWIPLILGCVGMCWLLASAGVFIRDIGHVVSAAVNMMMFLSPVFYPATALPENLQWLAKLNPLASIIEQTRMVLIDGKTPDPGVIGVGIVCGLIWCQLCFTVLRKAQPVFSDIL